MSHGQIGRLAINAKADIITTKLHCGNGKIGGNVAELGVNSLPNNPEDTVTLKMNSKPINEEELFATVSMTPPANTSSQNVKVSKNAALPVNAKIKHGTSSAGQLIHLIPLQVSNVNTTATATISTTTKAPQMANYMPLKIIAKSSNTNTQQNAWTGNVGKVTEIEKIIGTTLPNKESATDPLAVASLSGGPNIEVSGALANVFNKNMPAEQNVVPACPINSAMNGSSTILIHNQIPKAITGMQRVPNASEGLAAIIGTAKEEKTTCQRNINLNAPKPTGKLTESAPLILPINTEIIETKNMESQGNLVGNTSKIYKLETTSPINNELNKSTLPSSTSDKLQNCMTDQKQVVTSVASLATTASTTDNIKSNYTTVDMETQNNTLDEMVITCLLPENGLEMNPPIADIIENDMTDSNLSNQTVISEELKGSNAMLIIDDSSDEELQYDKMIDIKKCTDTSSSPMAFTHISNSVILTKAKPNDNKVNGSSRNLSPEPANVVLMKLPNAAKQATGTIKPSIEIPITEAFTLTSNVDNTKKNIVKIVSASKMLVSPPENQRPPTFMRCHSIPNTSQNLSPRAAKRCQSLNFNQPAKSTSGLNQSIPSKNVESHEKRRYSNPVKTLVATNTGTASEVITDQIDSSSSSDELNKENNDITFIELEDSFAEDFSEESNVSEENERQGQNGLKFTFEGKVQKNNQEDHMSRKSVNLDFKKEKDLAEKSSIATNDQNTNTKSFPSISNTQPLVDPQKHNKRSTSMSFSKSSQENNGNDDQIIKSLLCNENILAVTPSSSSSASSTQELSPSAPSNHSQSNARSALTPYIRDLNRIVDANAATARRICRDSSIASALSMVSTFDMLNWKEDRIASARGTTMRFELNEFNLLQVYERGCPPRYRIHTPYERPIYERYTSLPKTDQTDPLLYICRTCKLYGPAVDFLAPEFCSVECLKRTIGKRGSRDADILDNIDKKRPRKNAPISGTTRPFATSITSKQAPTFSWSTYLSNMCNVAAPIDLFLNPFPTGPNPFLVGMKVEAIDPENCSLFCVCTIVHIQGYRLRLNFDGYNSVYDFWVNADSMNIFPPGWCAKTNRILQPPHGYEPHKFDWPNYLKKNNSIAAEKKFFTHLNSTSMTNRNPFTVGMFLEADDLNDTGKLCVASVADILDERIRVHFDGWDDCYDYWVDISSPYIHPCGWHEGRQQLLVPPEYSNASFSWREYIRESQGLAAPTDFFVSRDPIDYRPSMKLEVVDPRNPSLIRPATVVHRTRHRVKIHFDCWPPEYTFCLEDDSADLHPIGWCDATGHKLEPPPTFHQHQKIMPCNTIGCRGLGNMDRSNGLTHANREFCPYVLENWRSKPEKKPRVEGKDIVRKIRQESTSSLLRNVKRPYNQSGNAIELQKQTEKPITMPYKQPTRGRPRNCDRLAAAAAAAAAAVQQQQDQQNQMRQSILKSEAIELGIKHGSNNIQVKKEPSTFDVRKSEPASKLSLAPSASPTTNSESKIVIAREFLCDYGPRLQQNYLLWRENANVDIACKVQSNPLLWSTAEVCTFIDSALSEDHTNTARYTVSSKFYNHDIDGAALLMLQQQDLMEILEFKLGPAIKLCSLILQLRMLVVSKYGSTLTKTEAAEQQVENLKNESELPK